MSEMMGNPIIAAPSPAAPALLPIGGNRRAVSPRAAQRTSFLGGKSRAISKNPKPRVGLHLLLADGDVDGDGVADVKDDDGGGGAALYVEVYIEEVDHDNGIVVLKPTDKGLAALTSSASAGMAAGKRRFMSMSEVAALIAQQPTLREAMRQRAAADQGESSTGDDVGGVRGSLGSGGQCNKIEGGGTLAEAAVEAGVRKGQAPELVAGISPPSSSPPSKVNSRPGRAAAAAAADTTSTRGSSGGGGLRSSTSRLSGASFFSSSNSRKSKVASTPTVEATTRSSTSSAKGVTTAIQEEHKDEDEDHEEEGGGDYDGGVVGNIVGRLPVSPVLSNKDKNKETNANSRPPPPKRAWQQRPNTASSSPPPSASSRPGGGGISGGGSRVADRFAKLNATRGGTSGSARAGGGGVGSGSDDDMNLLDSDDDDDDDDSGPDLSYADIKKMEDAKERAELARVKREDRFALSAQAKALAAQQQQQAMLERKDTQRLSEAAERLANEAKQRTQESNRLSTQYRLETMKNERRLKNEFELETHYVENSREQAELRQHASEKKKAFDLHWKREVSRVKAEGYAAERLRRLAVDAQVEVLANNQHQHDLASHSKAERLRFEKDAKHAAAVAALGGIKQLKERREREFAQKEVLANSKLESDAVAHQKEVREKYEKHWKKETRRVAVEGLKATNEHLKREQQQAYQEEMRRSEAASEHLASKREDRKQAERILRADLMRNSAQTLKARREQERAERKASEESCAASRGPMKKPKGWGKKKSKKKEKQGLQTFKSGNAKNNDDFGYEGNSLLRLQEAQEEALMSLETVLARDDLLMYLDTLRGLGCEEPSDLGLLAEAEVLELVADKLIHQRKLLALHSKFKALHSHRDKQQADMLVNRLNHNTTTGSEYNTTAAAAAVAATTAASNAPGGEAGGGGGGGKGSRVSTSGSTNSLPSDLGTGGSSDLADFLTVFESLADMTDRGKQARKAAFSSADPNGNGLCSLAELEGFVLKALLKFTVQSSVNNNNGPSSKDTDKTNHAKKKGIKATSATTSATSATTTAAAAKKASERGRDVFDAFRPCYLRAFSDAKDFKADSGAVLAGTKKASQDDFVSKGEFRLFCAYLCVYAAMFDAFAKIDGGGAGRSANDDRRIDLKEWLDGYRGVSNSYGLVAFKGLNGGPAAKALFLRMDDNGGGFVLLDEFCTFLKACEMVAGTELGGLLGADEAGGVGKQDRATKEATSPRASIFGFRGIW